MPGPGTWSSGMFRRSSLAVFGCFLGIGSLVAQSAHPSYTQSPMARLRRQFAVSGSAEEENLLGRWIAVKEIWTEDFLTGKTGPDHVESDKNGLRRTSSSLSVLGRPRTNVAGNPLEWTLTFQNKANHLQATSEVPWEPTGDTSNVKFSKSGDFTFSKDYGGDALWTYHCRAATSSELICVLDGGKGHGVVFVKKEGTHRDRNQ